MGQDNLPYFLPNLSRSLLQLIALLWAKTRGVFFSHLFTGLIGGINSVMTFMTLTREGREGRVSLNTL